MAVIGTHRILNEGLEAGVWITDGPGGFEIPQSWYLANAYWPAFADLPWGQPVAGGGLD